MPYQYDYNEIVGRANPTTSALAGMAGMQNVFAKQAELNAFKEKQLEQNKLRDVMQGQDWKNPDIGSIMAVAPKMGMDFIKQLGQMNTEQRLVATEHAKETMNYFNAGLHSLWQDPSRRDEMVGNLVKLGVKPELTNLIPPYNGNLEEFRKGIGVMIAPIQGLQGITQSAHIGAQMDLENQKNEHVMGQIGARTTGQLQVEDRKEAIAKINKVSGTIQYFDESTKRHHVVRLGPNGEKIDTEMNENYRPYKAGVEGGGRAGGGKGGKDTGPGIGTGGRRQPGGAGPMNALPPAGNFPGKRVYDTEKNQWLKSDGTNWNPE